MASNQTWNSICCPSCGGKCRTVTSRMLSPSVREIYFDCRDVDCACRFVAHLGIVRVVQPALDLSVIDSSPLTERRANDILVPSAKLTSNDIPPQASPAPASTEAPRQMPMAIN